LLIFILFAVAEIHRLLTYTHSIFSWLANATPAEAANTLSAALFPFRATGIAAAAIAALIAWRAWTHRARLKEWAGANPGAAITLATLIAAPLLIWAFGFAAKPIFMTRTLLIAVPATLMGFALLLRFEHRALRFAAIALTAASLLATGTTRQKEDWRAIAARAGSDTVLLCQLSDAAAMRHARPESGRTLLRADQGVIELWRTPWATRDYQILSSKTRLEEGKLRGMLVPLDSAPVWPIRSGKLHQMATAPMTLRQAIIYCDNVRLKDREPRYIAE
jgi:hypothetical protein